MESDVKLGQGLDRLNNLSKWVNRAKGLAKLTGQGLADVVLEKALNLPENAVHGTGSRLAQLVGADPEGIPANLGNLASYFFTPTMVFNALDAIYAKDQINQANGLYDNAHNREVMQNISDLDRHYEQEKLLYKDNPQLMQVFTDDYNNKRNLLTNQIDRNSPFQQYSRNVANAMGDVVQAIAENSAPTNDFILSNKGLASLADNKSKRVFYKDVDLGSELSRQILAGNDYKRSYQDYADRKDLSEKEKQTRAVADVIAYNNMKNA